MITWIKKKFNALFGRRAAMPTREEIQAAQAKARALNFPPPPPSKEGSKLNVSGKVRCEGVRFNHRDMPDIVLVQNHASDALSLEDIAGMSAIARRSVERDGWKEFGADNSSPQEKEEPARDFYREPLSVPVSDPEPSVQLNRNESVSLNSSACSFSTNSDSFSSSSSYDSSSSSSCDSGSYSSD